MNATQFLKRKIRGFIARRNFLRKGAITYCADNHILPNVFTRTPSAALREMLCLPSCEYTSQLNQDVFALLVNQFRPGFFLEIGANDGFTFSNTVFLERVFGWRGVLVEANPKYKASLSLRKGALAVIRAVSTQQGSASFADAGLYGSLNATTDGSHERHTDNAPTITVDCATLQQILSDADAPRRIDFLSIDVEGGEVAIIEQMIAVKNRFRCGCIEHNSRAKDYMLIKNLLIDAGYKLMWERQTEQDIFFVDTYDKKVS